MFWSLSCEEVAVALGRLQLPPWKDEPDSPVWLLTPARLQMAPVSVFAFLLLIVGLATFLVLLCKRTYGEFLVLFPSMPGSLGFVSKMHGTAQALLQVFGPLVARLTVHGFLVVALVLQAVLRLRGLWVVSGRRVALSHYP